MVSGMSKRMLPAHIEVKIVRSAEVPDEIKGIQRGLSMGGIPKDELLAFLDERVK